MWRPIIQWGAAVFGAAIAGTKLYDTSKTLITEGEKRGCWNGMKAAAAKIKSFFK